MSSQSMLLIPVSDETLSKFSHTNDDAYTRLIISSLSIPELASIFLFLKLPDLKGDVELKAKHSLADFINVANTSDRTRINNSLHKNFSQTKLELGLHTALENDFKTMSAEEVEKQSYLDRQGNWDWCWKPSEREPDLDELPSLEKHFEGWKKFTSEQGRILQIFLANPEESMDIQGYAGTGKTRTIANIVEALPKGGLLISAMTVQQLWALKRKVGSDVKAKTFGQIAFDVLKTNLFDQKNYVGPRTKYNYFMPNSEVAQKMAYQALGNLNAEWVTWHVMNTVRAFCYSADREIMLKHVKDSLCVLSGHDKSIIRNLADELWVETVKPNPSDLRPLPFRQYHAIKQFSLLDEMIPEQYQFIVIDEAHDLPQPLLQILDRSPQSVITFGDGYQSFHGGSLQHRRAKSIRRREMSNSYRAGESADALYNSILQFHPVSPIEPFKGAKTKSTEISHYEAFEIPEHHCALLSKNSWYVLSLMQKLSTSGARFYILERTKLDLIKLIGEAIELFQGRGICTHPLLRGFKSWESFIVKQDDKIIKQIHELFCKGYKNSDFDNALSKAESVFSEDAYVLGRVEDAKNMEFNEVVLMADTLEVGAASGEDNARIVNGIYTGISRAKNKLYIPGYLDGWMTDHLKVESRKP